jgi:hypothetical protein
MCFSTHTYKYIVARVCTCKHTHMSTHARMPARASCCCGAATRGEKLLLLASQQACAHPSPGYVSQSIVPMDLVQVVRKHSCHEGACIAQCGRLACVQTTRGTYTTEAPHGVRRSLLPASRCKPHAPRGMHPIVLRGTPGRMRRSYPVQCTEHIRHPVQSASQIMYNVWDTTHHPHTSPLRSPTLPHRPSRAVQTEQAVVSVETPSSELTCTDQPAH